MDREDGVEDFQVKRDRDNVGSHGEVTEQNQKKPIELASPRQCKESVGSTNNPQRCLDPPNQNDTMAKDG